LQRNKITGRALQMQFILIKKRTEEKRIESERGEEDKEGTGVERKLEKGDGMEQEQKQTEGYVGGM